MLSEIHLKLISFSRGFGPFDHTMDNNHCRVQSDKSVNHGLPVKNDWLTIQNKYSVNAQNLTRARGLYYLHGPKRWLLISLASDTGHQAGLLLSFRVDPWLPHKSRQLGKRVPQEKY